MKRRLLTSDVATSEDDEMVFDAMGMALVCWLRAAHFAPNYASRCNKIIIRAFFSITQWLFGGMLLLVTLLIAGSSINHLIRVPCEEAAYPHWATGGLF